MKKAVPIAVLVLLFGGAAWWSLTKPPKPVDELPPPQITPAQPAVEQPAPAPEATEIVSATGATFSCSAPPLEI